METEKKVKMKDEKLGQKKYDLKIKLHCVFFQSWNIFLLCMPWMKSVYKWFASSDFRPLCEMVA
jgi:hypothetical protein